MSPRAFNLDASIYTAPAWALNVASTLADGSTAAPDAPAPELALADTPLADPKRADKKEPDWHKTKAGETLWELSRRYHVPLALLEQINKAEVPDARKLGIGQWLRIPMKDGHGVAPTKAQVPSDAPPGLPRAWLDLMASSHCTTTAKVRDANHHLLGETVLKHGSRVIRDPNASLAGESLYVPGSRVPCKPKAVPSTHASTPPHAETNPQAAAPHNPAQQTAVEITAQARPAHTAVSAPPNVDLQKRLDAIALAWQRAVHGIQGTAGQTAGLASPALDALREMDAATQGLGAEDALKVMQAALPGIEAYDSSFRQHHHGEPLNHQGIAIMMKVIDRFADSSAAPDVLRRYARLGHWDESAIGEAITNGSKPDYVLALIERGDLNAERVLAPVAAVMENINSRSAELVGKWAQHDSKRVFMEPNLAGAMTKAIRHTALDDYHTGMGQEWQNERARLKERMDRHGIVFVEHKSVLLSAKERFSGLPDPVKKKLENLMDNKLSNFAAQSAQEDPRIVRTVNWQALLARFYSDLSYVSTFKLGEQGRKFGGDLGMSLVRGLLFRRLDLAKLTHGDGQLAKELLDTLDDYTKSVWARIFGLKVSDVEKATEAMKKVIADKMELLGNGRLKAMAENEMEAMKTFQKEVQKDLVAELSKVNGFHVSTISGKAFRSLGLTVAVIAFWGAWSNAIDKPGMQTGSKAVIESGGLVQKSLEFAGAMNLMTLHEGSIWAKLGGPIGSRVLSRASIGHELWKAGEAFLHHKWGRGFSLVGYAAGQGLAAFGKGIPRNTAWGAGLAGTSLAAGLWVEAQERKFEHDPDHDDGVALRFLKHSGMTENVAREMLHLSEDGYCVVPLWVHYMEMHGTDFEDDASQKKAIAMLNSLNEDQLKTLSANLRRTADTLKGDPSLLRVADEVAGLPQRAHWQMSVLPWHRDDEPPTEISREGLDRAFEASGIAVP